MQWTTILLLSFSATVIEGFQICQHSRPTRRWNPTLYSSAEFEEPDVGTTSGFLDIVPNILPPIEPAMFVQEEEKEEDQEQSFTLSDESVGEQVEEQPSTKLVYDDNMRKNDQNPLVPGRKKVQPTPQAMMVGELLGMDKGAFSDKSVSSDTDNVDVPGGMRRVPMIKSYQASKVIKSFRKFGKHYPETILPKDLIDPITYTP